VDIVSFVNERGDKNNSDTRHPPGQSNNIGVVVVDVGVSVPHVVVTS